MSTFLKNCRRLLNDMPSRLSTAGITSNDSCENCHVNFNIIRKKRACCKCLRIFCSDCLLKREASCKSCAVLSSWPVYRPQLLQLKARDIKAFLTTNGVSTHGCVEKEELVDLALRYLGNRHQLPPYSPRRVSTQIVDDAWVLVNDASTAAGGIPPTVRTSSIPNEEAPSSSEPVHTMPTAATETEQQRSNPIPVPERISIIIDSASSISTSLPPFSSLDDNMAGERTFNKGPSSSLSESQPNLVSQTDSAASMAQEASGSSEGPQRAESQMSVDNSSLLTMSRTDLTSLSESALEKLSIKNLKVLLTKHRMDYRGCCEKEELLERVRRLRQQLQAQAKIDVGELSDENLCKVCMAAPIDCVLLDCGHLVTCTPCGKQMSECPVCRQYVVRVVKTFRA